MTTRLRLRFCHRQLFVLVASLLLLGAAAAPVASAARPVALVKIVKAPPKRTIATRAVFHFVPARLRARTLCRIDKRHYRPCRVRAKYSVRPGKHVFRVRARHRGRITVARRRWRVVRERPGSPLQPATGKLRFADEFNGSSVDSTHWSMWNGPGYNGYGRRKPSALSMSDGSLVLTAKMVDGTIETGGMSQKAQQRYGRYEFRVKTEGDPTGTMSGILMTWPKHQRSPQFTENDMYETGPSAARNKFTTFIHYGYDVRTQKIFEHSVDVTKWHTVVMDWRADALKIYRDGKLVWTVTDRAAIPDVLHHVNIQLDARARRTLSAPVRMWVDYIRIYE